MLLLTARFRLAARKNPVYDVKLTEESITLKKEVNDKANDTIQSDNKVDVTKLADVVGVKLYHGDRSPCACLHIYSYPRRKPRWGKEDRSKHELRLFICDGESPDGSMAIGDRWKCAILTLVRGYQFDPGSLTLPLPRKFLVLVNPASGSGKARKMYDCHVHPMFELAEAQEELVVTERAGHGRELMQNIDIEELKTFTAVVIVSGDGLANEVVNGLMDRKDWETAIQTPIAVIPGGSGNALVCSLLHAAGEPFTPNSAVFAVLRGQATPIDLATVQTREKTHYCFLSLTWGLVADVDINSEKYRFMGKSRFTVSFLSSIISYPKYRARLYYLPVDDSVPPEEDGTSCLYEGDTPRAHLLPLLSDGLSEDSGWKCIAGEFITIVAVMLTHLSPDLHVAPDATVNGGVVYVSVTQGDVPRMMMIKAFSGHTGAIQMIPAKAVRIEPDVGEQARHSYMAIDGEHIEYGAVQLQVHKGLGRVLAIRTENGSAVNAGSTV